MLTLTVCLEERERGGNRDGWGVDVVHRDVAGCY
jgi:hypothetical protein